MLAVIIIVVVVIIAVAAWLLTMRKSSVEPAEPSPPAAVPAPEGGFALRPPVADFHVEAGDAHVYFSVPMPEGDPDPVLTKILLSAAVETLRDKRSHLPLDGVNVVHAHGVRNGRPVSAGSITLDGPGELPDPAALHSLVVRADSDLFESIGGAPAQAAPANAADLDSLSPLTEELQLTGSIEAGLRTQGVDPSTATTADLVTALLRLGGYTVPPEAGSPMLVNRGGARTFVSVIEHEPGEHPTLSESAVNQFIAQFSQSGAVQGLLFTPKFGPFLIYEKERREPRVRYITRERFQAFVNSIAVG